MSKQATKSAKNRPFLLVLLLGLCGTVAHDREGLELRLRCLFLEKRLLHWDKLDSTLKLLSFCCYRSISAQLSRFLAIFYSRFRLRLNVRECVRYKLVRRGVRETTNFTQTSPRGSTGQT